MTPALVCVRCNLRFSAEGAPLTRLPAEPARVACPHCSALNHLSDEQFRMLAGARPKSLHGGVAASATTRPRRAVFAFVILSSSWFALWLILVMGSSCLFYFVAVAANILVASISAIVGVVAAVTRSRRLGYFTVAGVAFGLLPTLATVLRCGAGAVTNEGDSAIEVAIVAPSLVAVSFGLIAILLSRIHQGRRGTSEKRPCGDV